MDTSDFQFSPPPRERTLSVNVMVSVRRPGDKYDKTISDGHTLYTAESDLYAASQIITPMLLSCLTELKDNEAKEKETSNE